MLLTVQVFRGNLLVSAFGRWIGGRLHGSYHFWPTGVIIVAILAQGTGDGANVNRRPFLASVRIYSATFFATPTHILGIGPTSGRERDGLYGPRVRMITVAILAQGTIHGANATRRPFFGTGSILTSNIFGLCQATA